MSGRPFASPGLASSSAFAAVAIFAAATVSPVHGQRAVEAGMVLHSRFAAQESAARTGNMVSAGVLAAVGGLLGGGFVGYHLERRYWPCTCDDPGLGGMILGSAAGAALAIPAAVHLANRRRGSWAPAAGVSLLIGGLGVLGLRATATSSGALLFVFGPPAAELFASILIEQSTAK